MIELPKELMELRDRGKGSDISISSLNYTAGYNDCFRDMTELEYVPGDLVTELVEALGYYADPTNWEHGDGPYNTAINTNDAEADNFVGSSKRSADFVGGKTARQAIDKFIKEIGKL